MLLTQLRNVIYCILYGKGMLGCIAVYQEINSLETAQICIRLRQRQLEAIGKSTHAAIYVFNNIMCRVHMPNDSDYEYKHTSIIRDYKVFSRNLDIAFLHC